MKIEFSAPYWSLDQAKAWALTRHPELVSWAAKPANFKGTPVALAARIVLSLERARRQGQDVNAELWRASGRPPPIESSSARNDEPESLSEYGPDNSQRQEQPEGDQSDLARCLSFQSKTTWFSFFGPEGSNPGKAAKRKAASRAISSRLDGARKCGTGWPQRGQVGGNLSLRGAVSTRRSSRISSALPTN